MTILIVLSFLTMPFCNTEDCLIRKTEMCRIVELGIAEGFINSESDTIAISFDVGDFPIRVIDSSAHLNNYVVIISKYPHLSDLRLKVVGSVNDLKYKLRLYSSIGGTRFTGSFMAKCEVGRIEFDDFWIIREIH